MKITQTQFAQLAIKLTPHKENLQKRIDNNELTEISVQYKCATSTMKKVLAAIGVEFKGRRASHPFLNMINNLNIVVTRIAKELNVDYKEIQ